MADFYGNLGKISHSLIKRFGQPCNVTINEQGSYNPATGERKKGNWTVQKGYCLFDNLAFDFPHSGNDSHGGSALLVQQGDVLIYLTADCKPTLNAVIEANGEKWSVINVQPIRPAATTLIYQVQGRKADG
ncbi:hypothetical protein [Mannheimia haemolytica]|uniref:hypothetical protein n=1 Tax=Mannheimia haemolytica TaxID=75985 RepID=UPI001CF3D052|nr:hypothetical protein [Mannheimia haemolytica]MCB4228116.1 hypothetical protein [Mannheimia haemolytica]